VSAPARRARRATARADVIEAEAGGAGGLQLLSNPQGEEGLGQVAVALPPAGDHKSLAAPMLLFHPRAAAPPLRVRGVEPLGHHASESLLGGRHEQRVTLADKVARRPAYRTVQLQFGQQLPLTPARE